MNQKYRSDEETIRRAKM